ncbi:MAG: 3'-5' exonuclease [Flavobacteriia bacterium]|nr:3'-5' exonuclease [Flavobacteriia bacterium]
MKLILKRPLAVFDLETTGLNITKDRIVEIAVIKINVDGSEESYSKRVNPEMLIPLESSLIHGIYDEDVKDAPTFASIADELVEFLGEADLGGYNSNKFDIPVLSEELLRVGNNFDVSNRKFVDVQNIFHKMEQRTLAAAYLFYCNKNIENAHNALADTEATWHVLKAQLEKYDTLEGTIDFLSDFSKGSNLNLIDFAGRLAFNENGEAVYNFGKNKGKLIKDIAKSEPGYYGWMLDADFPLNTKQCLKREMDKIKQENQAEIKKEFIPKKENKQTPKPEDNLSFEEKLNLLKGKFK